MTADLMAAEDVLKRGITGIDVVKALAEMDLWMWQRVC